MPYVYKYRRSLDANTVGKILLAAWMAGVALWFGFA